MSFKEPVTQTSLIEINLLKFFSGLVFRILFLIANLEQVEKHARTLWVCGFEAAGISATSIKPVSPSK